MVFILALKSLPLNVLSGPSFLALCVRVRRWLSLAIIQVCILYGLLRRRRYYSDIHVSAVGSFSSNSLQLKYAARVNFVAKAWSLHNSTDLQNSTYWINALFSSVIQMCLEGIFQPTVKMYYSWGKFHKVLTLNWVNSEKTSRYLRLNSGSLNTG